MTTTGKPDDESQGQAGLPVRPPEMDDDGVDPSGNSIAKQLWDIVAIYGPASRAELHEHRPPDKGGALREFQRHHPEYRKVSTAAAMLKAERWTFDRAIDLSLSRGWLVADDEGLISIGQAPPGHVGLTTMSDTAAATHVQAAQIRSRLLAMPSKTAIEILTAKTNIGRMKPNQPQERAAYKAFEKSLLGPAGQILDVIMWQPHPMVWPHPIVVDGQSRKEILERRGLPVRVTWLPEATPAAEVLYMRIQLEIASNAGKDRSPAGRDAYIKQLAAAGFNQQQIGDLVGVTHQRVSQILSQVQVDLHLGQESPSAADVTEFRALRDAGWTLRDIADRTQWSKNTIARYLAKPEIISEEPRSTDTPSRPGRKPTAHDEWLAMTIEMGPATDTQIRNALKSVRSFSAYQKCLTNARRQGEVTTKGKKPLVLEATQKARDRVAGLYFPNWPGRPEVAPRESPPGSGSITEKRPGLPDTVAPVINLREVEKLPDIREALTAAGVTPATIGAIDLIMQASHSDWPEVVQAYTPAELGVTRKKNGSVKPGTRR